jgi:hypothetical protein
MSSSVTIPARPRPGRKPLPADEQVDRRRMQNRVAQRNFRDKRQQKLVETQQELEAKKQEYRDEVSKYERNLDAIHKEYKAQLAEQQAQLNNQQARIAELSRLLQQAQERAQQFEERAKAAEQRQGNYTGRPALGVDTNARGPHIHDEITPPHSDDYAQDFTNFRTRGHTLKLTPSNESINSGQGNAKDCGFCTGNTFCPCEHARLETERRPALSVQPGGCDQCQRDPQRRAACMALASGSNAESRPVTSDSMMGPSSRISCGRVVDLARKEGINAPEAMEGVARHATMFPSESGQGYDLAMTDMDVARTLSNMKTGGQN